MLRLEEASDRTANGVEEVGSFLFGRSGRCRGGRRRGSEGGRHWSVEEAAWAASRRRGGRDATFRSGDHIVRRACCCARSRGWCPERSAAQCALAKVVAWDAAYRRGAALSSYRCSGGHRSTSRGCSRRRCRRRHRRRRRRRCRHCWCPERSAAQCSLAERRLVGGKVAWGGARWAVTGGGARCALLLWALLPWALLP